MTAEQIVNNVHDVMGHYDGRLRPWAEGAVELLIGNMIVALFDLAAANELDRLPLAQWRADAGAHANAGRVINLIDHLERLFVTGETDAWATVVEPISPDWSAHIASTLAAVLLERLAPDELLTCHALWSHYLVQPHLRVPVAASAALMVTRDWRSMIATPGLFVSPNTSFTQMRAAINDPSFGWSKTRAVLLAALAASQLPEGDQSRATIESMAD